MQTADTHCWRITWQPHPSGPRLSGKIRATSKFGAKKTARHKLDIPASCVIHVTRLEEPNAKA